MKFFWKIYIPIFFLFFVVFSAYTSYDVYKHSTEVRDIILESNFEVSTIVKNEVRTGYLVNKWPYEMLNELTKRDDFMFWWVVKEDGHIFRSDNLDFVGLAVNDYFPDVEYKLNDEAFVEINEQKDYGIIISPIKHKVISFCQLIQDLIRPFINKVTSSNLIFDYS
ncbi:hypothetical protein ACFLZ6_00305 [Nanoarchaeota archaeon]